MRLAGTTARRSLRRTLITASISGLLGAQLIPSAAADPVAPVPHPVLFPLVEGQVIRVASVAGTGTPTADYDIGATDLCDFVDFPSEVLQICGDSFAGQGVGFGPWHSPIALRVDRESIDDPAGVRYTGVIGVSQPLLAEPTPAGFSQLPAGVVSINRDDYLLVATAKGLVPQTTRLVRADPAQGRWQTVPDSVRDGGYQGGRQSQIAGYYDPVPTADSPAGWVYIVADNFHREEPAVLYRATPDAFTDRSRWQGWAAGPGGGWNKTPTPLWPDKVGEMSIRQIDGKTVLSYFNAGNWDMEVRVADDPALLGSAPVTTVVRHDEWPEPPVPADTLPGPFDNRLAQPYGGYISPGSTLNDLRIFVSQWRTDPRERAPYRVIQFAVNPFKP